MIDRKALWISLLVLAAMIVADLWRLSLLPDWHHFPANGPGSHAIPAVMLFTPVLAILFTLGLIFTRRWLRSGSVDAVQSWGRWYGHMLLFNTAAAACAQTFTLARSLGALRSVNPLTFLHFYMVATGVFLILVGNMLPKMPWLLARSHPLDPWQWKRHLRFGGRIMVGFGVFIALAMPLLPVQTVVPVMLGMAITILAANYWYRARVRRQPTPQA